MCPLNHVGVPIFCPTTSYITTAKRSVCFVVSKFKFALILAFLCDWKLYCFFRKCLRVGFGHSRRPLICSKFVFNIPDRSVHCLGRPRICNIFPSFGSVMTADNTVKERQTVDIYHDRSGLYEAVECHDLWYTSFIFSLLDSYHEFKVKVRSDDHEGAFILSWKLCQGQFKMIFTTVLYIIDVGMEP